MCGFGNKISYMFKFYIQRCSQNAEKVMHIKELLLDQEVIFFNCVTF